MADMAGVLRHASGLQYLEDEDDYIEYGDEDAGGEVGGEDVGGEDGDEDVGGEDTGGEVARGERPLIRRVGKKYVSNFNILIYVVYSCYKYTYLVISILKVWIWNCS
jgi:hypothetical protein